MSHRILFILITFLTLKTQASDNVIKNLNSFVMSETAGNYGFAYDNSNYNFLEKTKLCSNLILLSINPSGTSGILAYSCDNKAQSTAVRLTIKQHILIAKGKVFKGDEITPGNAEFKDIYTSKKYQLPKLTSRIAARKDIRNGQWIENRNTKVIPDILAGENITQQVSGKGFNLSRNIKALESGYIGDVIKVQDKATKNAVIIEKDGKIDLKIINF